MTREYENPEKKQQGARRIYYCEEEIIVWEAKEVIVEEAGEKRKGSFVKIWEALSSIC